MNEIPESERKAPFNAPFSHAASPGGKPEIGRDRVAAWWLALEDIGADDWPLLEALLPDEELTRAQRFHFDRDRDVYIAAHALCRGLLTGCAGSAPRDWRFTVEDHGKPEVVSPAGMPRLRVNISHTRGLAAVALTAENDIGVDVEWLQREAATEQLAERVFAPRERQVLAAASEAQKTETFLTFWTLKEAYVKAIGKGLSQPLGAFHFDLGNLAIAFDDPKVDDPSKWQFARWRPGPDHLMALAIRHPDPARLQIEAGPAPLDYLRALAGA